MPKEAKIPSSSAMSELLRPLMGQLNALETLLMNKCDLLSEYQRVVEVLRQKDKQLAEKDAEISELRRDLAYEKEASERKLEYERKMLEEKWVVMQKETAEKLDLERKNIEDRLALEEKRCSEKLTLLNENHTKQIEELKRHESIWSKIMKMMTWS